MPDVLRFARLLSMPASAVVYMSILSIINVKDCSNRDPSLLFFKAIRKSDCKFAIQTLMLAK